MVGSALACGLARHGLAVAIVDQKTAPLVKDTDPPHIRVSAISYTSEQVLRNSGIWQGLPDRRLKPYTRLAVNEMPASSGLASRLPDISGWAQTEFSAKQLGLSHLGHIIENDVIQSGLHRAMADDPNIHLACPVEIVQLQVKDAIKRVELANGEFLEAPLIIGADGALSKVRALAGIAQYKEQYTQQALVCTVAHEGVAPDITWQTFTPSGPRAYLPLSEVDGQAYASLVWYDSPETISRLKSLQDFELLQSIRQAFPARLPKLSRLVECASFPLYKSHAQVYVQQGLALVGDAAHTINPLAGQGANLGFMDVAVLIEELVRARLENQDMASLQVLERYQKRRRRDNVLMMQAMDAFYHGFSNEHLPLRIMRNIGLGLANHAGLLKQLVLKHAVGISKDMPRLAKPA